MINKEQIENIITDPLKENDLFLIDLNVSHNNKIKVVIDSMKGVTIDECVTLSKVINTKLDKDIEVYALEVTSPGINAPMTHHFQYRKNLGKELDVMKKDGIKVKGILKEINTDFIIIKKKGNNKQSELDEKISFDDIKSARVMITF